jgi:hypothetical protein
MEYTNELKRHGLTDQVDDLDTVLVAMANDMIRERQALLEQLGTLEARLDEAREEAGSGEQIDSLLAQLTAIRAELRK